MLLGCCHCGDEPPSESDPPSESTPPSESESLSESQSESSESGSSESLDLESSSCILLYGCVAIPRSLRVTITTTGARCHCQYFNGTFRLKYHSCRGISGFSKPSIFYATDESVPGYTGFFTCNPPIFSTGPLTARLLHIQINSPPPGGPHDRYMYLNTGDTTKWPFGTGRWWATWEGGFTNAAACLFNPITLNFNPGSDFGCTVSAVVTVEPW